MHMHTLTCVHMHTHAHTQVHCAAFWPTRAWTRLMKRPKMSRGTKNSGIGINNILKQYFTGSNWIERIRAEQNINTVDESRSSVTDPLASGPSRPGPASSPGFSTVISRWQDVPGQSLRAGWDRSQQQPGPGQHLGRAQRRVWFSWFLSPKVDFWEREWKGHEGGLCVPFLHHPRRPVPDRWCQPPEGDVTVTTKLHQHKQRWHEWDPKLTLAKQFFNYL